MKLEEIRESIIPLVLASGKERQDFYTWAGAVIGASPNAFEFCMSLFPAIFFDIIAPIGLLVALKKSS